MFVVMLVAVSVSATAATVLVLVAVLMIVFVLVIVFMIMAVAVTAAALAVLMVMIVLLVVFVAGEVTGIGSGMNETQEVGDFGRVACAGTVSDVAGSEDHGPVDGIGERGDQSGSGGGRHLVGNLGTANGEVFQNGQRPGGGYWHDAMRAAYRAGADGDGSGIDALDAEGFHAENGADDVNEAVEPADFVEVDLVDGHVVCAGFGDGQAGKGRAGEFLDDVGKRGLFDNGKQVVQMAMGMRHVLDDDVDFGRRDLVAFCFGEAKIEALDVERTQRLAKVVEIDAEIDKSTEEHVAGDTGKRIDVENFHEEVPGMCG